MLRDAAISFPMLGGLTLDFPASFTLFGHEFYLYGVVMAIAFIAAVFYASKRAPQMGIKGDDIFGLVLWVLPIAIVAAGSTTSSPSGTGTRTTSWTSSRFGRAASPCTAAR